MTLRLIAACAALIASGGAIAQGVSLAAPNVVEISPRLVTAGQPSAAELAKLKGQGFEAVIYLAPPTVRDAVRDEHLILARQGLTYINLPVQFDNPTEADFRTFVGLLQGLGARKVLVHCQVNMRASAMVFLYRAIVLKEDPRRAYEAVTRVWSPSGPWRKLVEDQLRKHRIAFELL